MAHVKDDVIKMIEGLPDDVGVADIIAELYFRLKVERGLDELDQGKGVSQAVARDKLKQWLS
jgi:hypothetical protein